MVQWTATQLQNSNGKVGLQGNSYAGINQTYTVAALGPNSPVKAIVPYCMGAEFYRETYFAGGIPTQTLNFQRVIGDSMGGTTATTGADFVSEVTAGGPRAYDGRSGRLELLVSSLRKSLMQASPHFSGAATGTFTRRARWNSTHTFRTRTARCRLLVRWERSESIQPLSDHHESGGALREH